MTIAQRKAERRLMLLARRPTRRRCLELAREAFGEHTKFLRTGGKYVVTRKPPREAHVVLGESEKGWLEAIEAAATPKPAAAAEAPSAEVAAS